MGPPVGNRNSANGKLWKAALIRALERRAADNGRHRNDELDALAERFLCACSTGDMVALKDLADRLDGKPPQAIVGDEDSPPMKVEGFINLVKPK